MKPRSPLKKKKKTALSSRFGLKPTCWPSRKKSKTAEAELKFEFDSWSRHRFDSWSARTRKDPT
jgi:predicted alpha/beta hydrolase family esterase